MFNVLVCEDDRNIRRLMCEYLEAERYQVYESANGLEALDMMASAHIDLIVTDVMMPGMDGFELARSLRDSGYTLPILMITAKGAIDDKRTGFVSGTDDYMVKPVDMDEMLLRVGALLRRAKVASERVLEVGTTRFDYDSFTVSWRTESVGTIDATRTPDATDNAGNSVYTMTLPKKEFMLIYLLLSRENKIVTRQQIMDEIWGYDTESDEQTVNVHIRRLRERFEGNRDFEIVTVKGLGYKAVRR